ncbi:MAG: serine/threonine protein phosphatase [Bacteroidota bacterium]|nr:serine/threonine protein phosphatase [Bacteroidota bacterium]
MSGTEKTYIITDIHGCLKTFMYLVRDIMALNPDDNLYLLGDYIDRGPDSKGILDLIIELKEKGFKVFPLRGNHEQFVLNATKGLQRHQFWLENGGHQTLASFNAETVFDIPQKYIDFIESLPYYFELENYFLVHAGFNFQDGKPFEDFHSMMTIRNFQIDKRFLGNKKIIHGHTPLPLYEIRRDLKDNDTLSFNLDGGCVYKNVSGLGNLLALELQNWELIIQPNID